MNDKETSLGQITGLVAGIIIGAIIMILGRLPFSWGIAPLILSVPDDWLRTNYNPSAFLVFLTSAIAAVAWYLIALKWWNNYHDTKEEKMQAKLIWFLLGILAVAGVVLGIIIWGNEEGGSLQIPSFIVFAVTLSLGMLSSYWLATVWSTPSNILTVIPFYDFTRR